MSVDVEPLADPADEETLEAILAQAFAVDRPLARRWMARAGQHEVRVARSATGIVGGLLRVPMGQSFGGRFVPTLGIAGVAVAPDHRRRGVATEIMRQALTEAWESGTALSTLYASNQPLYRSVGYEQAGTRWRARLIPQQIQIRETDGGPIQQLTSADTAAVQALYRGHALARPGHLDRGLYQWDRLIHSDDPADHASGSLLWETEDNLEAYVLYRQRRDGDRVSLEVTDTASRSARGWRRIWTHLADLSSNVAVIELSTSPTDPLFLVQPHPHTQLQLWAPFLVRVVDPAIALEARGYPLGQPERVAVRIIDPLFGDVALTVDVEDGRAAVRKGGDPTARVHIRGLSAMYTGFLSPYEAASVGLVEAGPRSLAALQALFAGPSPWMRDSF